MASIRRRGDQQWEARIRRKGQPLTCRTFSTKTQAELWARQLEAEMDRGAFVSRTEAERTTLREALERYTVDYLPKLKSAAKETIRARALARRPLADKALAAIRSHDIARLRDTLAAESLAANSIRLDLALLSRLFNVAHREWGMESLGNPVTQVSKPRLPPGRDRRLQGDEEARLLAAFTEGVGLCAKEKPDYPLPPDPNPPPSQTTEQPLKPLPSGNGSPPTPPTPGPGGAGEPAVPPGAGCPDDITVMIE